MSDDIIAVCPECANTSFFIILGPSMDTDAAEICLSDVQWFECTRCQVRIRLMEKHGLILNH